MPPAARASSPRTPPARRTATTATFAVPERAGGREGRSSSRSRRGGRPRPGSGGGPAAISSPHSEQLRPAGRGSGARQRGQYAGRGIVVPRVVVNERRLETCPQVTYFFARLCTTSIWPGPAAAERQVVPRPILARAGGGYKGGIASGLPRLPNEMQWLDSTEVDTHGTLIAFHYRKAAKCAARCAVVSRSACGRCTPAPARRGPNTQRVSPAAAAASLPFSRDDPPADGLPVGRRLPLEEVPGGPVPFQEPLVRLLQVHAALFVGVDARLVLPPGLKGLEPGRLHPSLVDQGLGPPDVDAAPDAPRLAGREADRVAGPRGSCERRRSSRSRGPRPPTPARSCSACPTRPCGSRRVRRRCRRGSPGATRGTPPGSERRWVSCRRGR